MTDNIISVNDFVIPYIPESRINLDIRQGELIAICGENGSGKTTFARYLSGLLRPDRPGQIIVGGLDLYQETELYKLHRICSIVFQNPEDQIIYQQTEAEVAFGPENLGIEPSDISSRLNDVFDSMDLTNHRMQQVSRLSGGELQRVAVSDILIMKPKILILDEAAAMQDPDRRRDMNREIVKWARDEGSTVIFITHLKDELEFSDRVFEMKNGTLRELTKEEIKASANQHNGNNYGIKGTEFSRETVLNGIHISEYKAGNDLKQEIICRDVTFHYGGKLVLEHFTYSFRKGNLYILSGRTGTGKSTLAQLLNGLLRTDTGSITVNGNLLPSAGKQGFKQIRLKRSGRQRQLYLNQIRKTVGYVAQYPEKQLFADTVLQDVMFGPRNMGVQENQAMEQAKEALRSMELNEKLWERNPMTLSGGEKRRAAIAGILAMEPEYLVLDEPEAGLDEAGRALLIQVIQNCLSDGKGVIWISHFHE